MSSPAATTIPEPDLRPNLETNGTRRITSLVAGISILVHAVLAWLMRAPTIGTGNDDAVYLLLGRALREGHYRELFYVTTQVHSQYPPGYPAVLAILGAPMDGELGLVIAANIVFSCAALALVFDLMRRWSPTIAMAAVAVLALNPALAISASRVQSEPMFMALVMLALWSLRPNTDPRLKWVAVASVILATLTRSAGLAILGGIFLHFLLGREWRYAAGLAVAAAIVVAPWFVWTAVAPQQVVGRSYIADALLPVPPRDSSGARIERAVGREASAIERFTRTLRVRLTFNTRYYLTRGLPARLSVPTIPGTRIDNAAWLAAMLVAILAGLAAAWSRWRPAVLALAAYSVLLVIWPYAVGRFVIPVLPILVTLMLLGAWRLGARVGPRAALILPLLLAALPIAGGSRALSGMVDGRESCVPDEEESAFCGDVAARYVAAARRVNALAPEGAPVFTSKEGTFFYHTGRQVVSIYPIIGWPAERLAQYLSEHRAAMIFLPSLKYEEMELGEPLSELCESLTDAGSERGDILILLVRPPRERESSACNAIQRWRDTW